MTCKFSGGKHGLTMAAAAYRASYDSRQKQFDNVAVTHRFVIIGFLYTTVRRAAEQGRGLGGATPHFYKWGG